MPQVELLLSNGLPGTWPNILQPLGHLPLSQLGSRTESLVGSALAPQGMLLAD